MTCHVQASSVSTVRRTAVLRQRLVSSSRPSPGEPPPAQPEPPPVTVRQTVLRYLAHVQAVGIAETTQSTYQYVRSTVFAPVLSDKLADLTAENAAELRRNLERQVPKRTAAPYSETTIVGYWQICRGFSKWMCLQGWLTTDPLVQVRRVGGSGQ